MISTSISKHKRSTSMFLQKHLLALSLLALLKDQSWEHLSKATIETSYPLTKNGSHSKHKKASKKSNRAKKKSARQR